MPRALVYPRGLEVRGKRLWRETLAIRPRLGPGERVLLEEACRLADRLEHLNEQIAGTTLPSFEVDGTGTVVTLVTDAAQQEARLAVIALRQVMMSLGIDKLATPEPPAKPAPAAEGKGKPSEPLDPLDQITAARQKRAQQQRRGSA